MTTSDTERLDAPTRGDTATGHPQSRGCASADGIPDFEAWASVRWRRLVRTAYLLTGDHHEAEDLVQTTLAKVYLVWPRVSRLDEPDAYVHRALTNNNLSRFRRRRVVHLLTSQLPERIWPETNGHVETRDALLTALAAIPPRMRAVVVLRYWEDLSEEQVAHMLGCTPGTVKSQASRGLRKLRDHPALAAQEKAEE